MRWTQRFYRQAVWLVNKRRERWLHLTEIYKKKQLWWVQSFGCLQELQYHLMKVKGRASLWLGCDVFKEMAPIAFIFSMKFILVFWLGLVITKIPWAWIRLFSCFGTKQTNTKPLQDLEISYSAIGAMCGVLAKANFRSLRLCETSGLILSYWGQPLVFRIRRNNLKNSLR